MRHAGENVLAKTKPVFVNLQEEDLPSLPAALEKNRIEADFYSPGDVDEWVRALSNRQVLIAWVLPKFMQEVLESCEGLKMIQRFGIGCEQVPIDVASRKGIFVCNVPEMMAESVAQHAWSLILALASRVVETHARMALGKWEAVSPGTELWGKTLGIVGLGDVGKRMTEIGRALNTRILAYDPYISKPTAQMFTAKLVDLATLLKESDVVCLTPALTKETCRMIGEKELNFMKKTAFLINVSRGRVVNESELVGALEKKLIGGAGLDVFENEPLPEESPLRKLGNVVMTPHIASYTVEAHARTSEAVSENVARLLKNERPHWIVNIEGLRIHGYLQ